MLSNVPYNTAWNRPVGGSNPGVGAVPVNVIMIVLQIGPTYQTCIYFADKLMVLRCYDHNLNTDRKRRL